MVALGQKPALCEDALVTASLGMRCKLPSSRPAEKRDQRTMLPRSALAGGGFPPFAWLPRSASLQSDRWFSPIRPLDAFLSTSSFEQREGWHHSVEQGSFPVLLSHAPTAFNRIVFAIRRGIIRQSDGDLSVLCNVELRGDHPQLFVLCFKIEANEESRFLICTGNAPTQRWTQSLRMYA